ncbi:substrate-binding domain-containing protein [Saccharothrix syringae]|uniref:LacI family transcriptional regulator n=1 Tax=Saccharothrix syringae TaxID=103733 RepID=A0A5Q0GZ44_SACSY|nr:LacI family DNA-binding transcriptional regulator [Saccharothrix syringae]QFZ19123.1 LacI family transcriptional regulator [Saccharothrix syringae]
MVTIAEVARHAGLAVSTVSYALSGKRSVSPATRRRVEESARQLGYRSRRPDGLVLGVVVPPDLDAAGRWLEAFVAAAAARARRADATLVVTSPGAATSGCHGLVVLAPAPVPVLLDVPVVRVGPADDPDQVRVDVDRAAAGELCAEHLADLGHRAVAFVHRDPLAEFFCGLARGCDARGLEVRPHRWPARDLLGDTARPTAYVAADGAVLGDVLATLRAGHVRVPGDASVVALCPDEVAAPEGVTSISVWPAELGEAAVEAVLDDRAGRLLRPHLTVRGAARHDLVTRP